MTNFLLDFLYKKFEKQLFEKLRFEVNSYLSMKDALHPIRCSYLDKKVAVFYDDIEHRDRIKFFRDLPFKE